MSYHSIRRSLRPATPTNIRSSVDDTDIIVINDCVEHFAKAGKRNCKRANPSRSKLDVEERKMSKVKGTRGKLRMLTEMPLDVLFEIFEHMHPTDTLNLARTSKPLRRMLMSCSSASIWRSTLLNVPKLPARPKDLNEPQYVDLMFGKDCHFCSAANVKTFWGLRVRCCSKCLDTEFVDPSYFEGLFPMGLLPSAYAALSHKEDSRGRPTYLTRDVNKLSNRLKELGDCNTLAQTEFMTKAKEEQELKMMNLYGYEDFMADLKIERSRELVLIRTRRREAIMQKLTELGWGYELEELQKDNFPAFCRHPSVNQPKDLTDRIWTNHQDAIVEFMEKCQAERLEKIRQKLIRERMEMVGLHIAKYAASHPDEIVPGMADVCFGMPEVLDLVLYADNETEIAYSSFIRPMSKFADFSRKWRLDKDNTLCQILTKPCATEISTDLAPHQLATVYFQCQTCREAIQYPRVLTHCCMTESREWENVSLDLGLRSVADCSRQIPWNHFQDRIQIADDFCASASDVIRATNIDPKLATASQMDELDGRFMCLLCADENLRHITMSWRMAVKHGVTHTHKPDSIPKHWLFVDRPTETLVKVSETKPVPSMPKRCARCNEDVQCDYQKRHLTYMHGILRSDIHEDDFYPTLDYPLSETEPNAFCLD